MQQRPFNFSLQLALAALAGGIAVLGWAPFGWWPAALLAYALLFVLLRRALAVHRAAGIGLAFGVGLHALGHGWVFDALHQRTGLGWAPAMLSTIVFVVYLALFTALPCGLFARTFSPTFFGFFS